MILFFPNIKLDEIPEKTVIIYGGSFSPISTGHLQVITDILKLLPNVKFYIVPVNDSHQKKIIVGNDENGINYRLKMCEISVDYLKKYHQNCDISVSDYTFTQTNSSIDQETMEYFQKMHPDYYLYYLCGQDVFDNFSKWNEKSRDDILTNKYGLIIHPRTNGISSTKIRENYKMNNTITDVVPEVAKYLKQYNLLDQFK